MHRKRLRDDEPIVHELIRHVWSRMGVSSDAAKSSSSTSSSSPSAPPLPDHLLHTLASSIVSPTSSSTAMDTRADHIRAHVERVAERLLIIQHQPHRATRLRQLFAAFDAATREPPPPPPPPPRLLPTTKTHSQQRHRQHHHHLFRETDPRLYADSRFRIVHVLLLLFQPHPDDCPDLRIVFSPDTLHRSLSSPRGSAAHGAAAFRWPTLPTTTTTTATAAAASSSSPPKKRKSVASSIGLGAGTRVALDANAADDDDDDDDGWSAAFASPSSDDSDDDCENEHENDDDSNDDDGSRVEHDEDPRRDAPHSSLDVTSSALPPGAPTTRANAPLDAPFLSLVPLLLHPSQDAYSSPQSSATPTHLSDRTPSRAAPLERFAWNTLAQSLVDLAVHEHTRNGIPWFSDEPPRVVSEAYLVHQICLLMAGLPSDLFRSSTSSSHSTFSSLSSITGFRLAAPIACAHATAQAIDAHTRYACTYAEQRARMILLLRRHGSICNGGSGGTAYDSITSSSHTTTASSSRCFQRLCASLQAIRARHDELIVDHLDTVVNQPGPCATLLNLHRTMRPVFEQADVLDRVVICAADAQGDTAVLLSTLASLAIESSHRDPPHLAVLPLALFLDAYEPYVEWIDEWLAHARLPTNDADACAFMVEAMTTRAAAERAHEQIDGGDADHTRSHDFRLRTRPSDSSLCVPSFLVEVADAMLQAGTTRAQLTHLATRAPVSTSTLPSSSSPSIVRTAFRSTLERLLCVGRSGHANQQHVALPTPPAPPTLPDPRPTSARATLPALPSALVASASASKPPLWFGVASSSALASLDGADNDAHSGFLGVPSHEGVFAAIDQRARSDDPLAIYTDTAASSQRLLSLPDTLFAHTQQQTHDDAGSDDAGAADPYLRLLAASNSSSSSNSSSPPVALTSARKTTVESNVASRALRSASPDTTLSALVLRWFDDSQLRLDMLSQVFVDGMRAPVARLCASLSAQHFDALCHRASLFEWLEALRDFFLCANGTLVDDMLSLFFENLHWWEDAANNTLGLSTLLTVALQSQPPQSSVRKHLLDAGAMRVAVRSELFGAASAVSSLEALVFEVDLPASVSDVITPDALAKCNQALALIMQMRYAATVLARLHADCCSRNGQRGKRSVSNRATNRATYRRDRNVDRHPIAHQFLLLVAECTHFVHALLDYVMTQCVLREWPQFCAQLQDARARGVEAWRECHRAHLDRVHTMCLLFPKMASTLSTIRRVLQLCVDLRDAHSVVFLEWMAHTIDDVPVRRADVVAAAAAAAAAASASSRRLVFDDDGERRANRVDEEDEGGVEDDRNGSDGSGDGSGDDDGNDDGDDDDDDDAVGGRDALARAQLRERRRVRRRLRERWMTDAERQRVEDRFVIEHERRKHQALHCVEQARYQFRQHVRLLVVVLQKIVRSGVQLHLDELLTRINFNRVYDS